MACDQALVAVSGPFAVEELRILLIENLHQSWAHRHRGYAPRAWGRSRDHTVVALGLGSSSPVAMGVQDPAEIQMDWEQTGDLSD